MQELTRSGKSRAVVLVKALPQVSEVYGETVCVAAVDDHGKWVRLYPVTFRSLARDQQFGRWDVIGFDWRLPDSAKDRRKESLRVEAVSIKIERQLGERHREAFLNRTIITSTQKEYEQGNSLALLRPSDCQFHWRRRSADEIEKIRQDYVRLKTAPADLFGERPKAVDREPAPYDFFYQYKDDDGSHDARCHDWEIEATFLRRRGEMGEQAALEWMAGKFGEEYPRRGMLFAMGTHSQRNWQWMIIGVIRMNPVTQPTLF